MILREFDLDLPFIQNENNMQKIMETEKCSLLEASREDYDQNWRTKRVEFRLQTRCVTSLFGRLFGRRMKTDSCRKILVECVPNITQHRIRDFSGVCVVQTESDYEYFSRCDDFQKKQYALELLMSGIRRIASCYSWDLKPFEDVYHNVIELNYENEWIWKKPVSSRDRRHNAYVFCKHGVHRIEIFIIIQDKFGNEVRRDLVISERPDEWAYAHLLGSLKWTSNEVVVLMSKNGGQQWAVGV